MTPPSLSLPTIYLRDTIVSWRDYAVLDKPIAELLVAQFDIPFVLPLRIPHFAYIEESPGSSNLVRFWHFDRWFTSNEKLERDKELSAKRVAQWEAEMVANEQRKKELASLMARLKPEFGSCSDSKLLVFAERIVDGRLTIERLREILSV